MAIPRPSPVLIHFFMVLFGVSAVLGILPSYDRNLSEAALIMIVASVGLYFLIAVTGQGRGIGNFFAGLSFLVVAYFALIFILQYDHFGYSETPAFITRIGRITTRIGYQGFTPQSNAAAMFMASFIPLGIALALPNQPWLARGIRVASTLLLIYGVFLTFSRGAYAALCVVAVMGILTIVAQRYDLPLWLPLGIGLIVIAFGIGAIIVIGPERIPVLGSTVAAAFNRFTLYRNSIFVGSDYAITGTGVGDTFALIYSRYGLLIQVPFLTYPHNLPLSIWLNQGLLGLVAFIGFIVTFYSYVFGVASAGQPRLVFHGAWLGVTVILLHGLTDAPQYSDNRWMMPALFVLAGLAVATGRGTLYDAEFEDGIEFVSAWRTRIIALSIVILVLGATAFGLRQYLRVAWYTNLGALDETRGDLSPNNSQTQLTMFYDSAEAYYRQGLEIMPNYPNANRRLGNLLVNMEDFADAVPFLEAAYEAEPANPAAHKGLGLAYVWTGETDKAAQLFNELDNPREMESELYTWGSYRTGRGQSLLAARAWETAVLMYPDAEPDPDVWLLVANTFRDGDDNEKAEEWYNRVLEVDPENEIAVAGLAGLE